MPCDMRRGIHACRSRLVRTNTLHARLKRGARALRKEELGGHSRIAVGACRSAALLVRGSAEATLLASVVVGPLNSAVVATAGDEASCTGVAMGEAGGWGWARIRKMAPAISSLWGNTGTACAEHDIWP